MSIHYVPDIPAGTIFANRHYAVSKAILPTKRIATKLVFGNFSLQPYAVVADALKDANYTHAEAMTILRFARQFPRSFDDLLFAPGGRFARMGL